MAIQWQPALVAIANAGALPVLTILLNGKENHELTDCYPVEIIDFLYKAN
jgi:hypothetical protein